jgi:hypothetical protein
MKTIEENKMSGPSYPHSQMRCEKSTKEKSQEKIQNVRGKNEILKLTESFRNCATFFFANESFMHAKHPHTPC